jgi:hypothetical protein
MWNIMIKECIVVKTFDLVEVYGAILSSCTQVVEIIIKFYAFNIF